MRMVHVYWTTSVSVLITTNFITKEKFLLRIAQGVVMANEVGLVLLVFPHNQNMNVQHLVKAMLRPLMV